MQVVRRACWKLSKGNAEPLRCLLGIGPLDVLARMLGIEQDSDTAQVRDHLAQEFERLAVSSGAISVRPVMLGCGRARLSAKPAATGSPLNA